MTLAFNMTCDDVVDVRAVGVANALQTSTTPATEYRRRAAAEAQHTDDEDNFFIIAELLAFFQVRMRLTDEQRIVSYMERRLLVRSAVSRCRGRPYDAKKEETDCTTRRCA